MKNNNSLDGASQWVAGFLALGIFAAVAVIVLSSIQGAVTQCSVVNTVYNTTLGACAKANSSGMPVANGSFTSQYNISGSAVNGVGNVTSQFGTAGTLVGLGILALAAVAILGYFMYNRKR